MRKSSKKALLPQHLDDLRRSGLSDLTIEQSGIYSETDGVKIARMLHRNGTADLGSCLVFPFPDADGRCNGYCRLKPSNPRQDDDGKPIKYESPLSISNHAYMPQLAREAIQSGADIFLTEGEKKALAGCQAGYPMIGLVGVWGFAKKQPKDGDGNPTLPSEMIDDLAVVPWQGRKVFLVFDSDVGHRPDLQRAEFRLAGQLTERGAMVKIVRLPGGIGADKVGLDDFLLREGKGAFELLVKSAKKPAPPKSPKKPMPGGQDTESMADRLVKLARDGGADLFHTADDTGYSLVPVGSHLETWPVKSTGFRKWLTRMFYEAEEKAANNEALGAAIATLDSIAHFDGDERMVYVRYGGLAGKTYVDLGDAAWRAVEIDAGGWRIIDKSPVHFRRASTTLALPDPVRGGALQSLRDFVNVKDDSNWLILLGYLFAAANPRGPFPLLPVFGEPGAAKTSLGKMVQKAVDPRHGGLRSAPKCCEDLVIAAHLSWLVAYDNFSNVPKWLSDALCRLATGGGLGKRQLYTDADEVVFDVRRPTLVTAINEVVDEPDLLNRVWCLQLERLPAGKRRTEEDLFAEFDAALPGILGGMYDAISKGMRTAPTVRDDRLPRMADAAKWAESCMQGAGHGPDVFLTALNANAADASTIALEASPLTPFLLSPDGFHFHGTAKELLGKLNEQASDELRKKKEWPQNARAMGHAIKTMADNLRKAGMTVEVTRGSPPQRARLIKLEYDPDGGDGGQEKSSPPDKDRDFASTSSTSSTPPTGLGETGVDDVDALDAKSRRLSEGVEFQLITAPADLTTVMQALDESERVGLDVETSGLNARTDRIRLLQLATDRGVFLVDCFAVDPRPLFDALADVEIVVHNAAFDLGFLWNLGFRPGKVYDLMIASRLLTAGTTEGNSLGDIAQREFDITLDKKLQKADWTGELSAEQLQYAALDASITSDLHAALVTKIMVADLERVAGIEMRAVPAFLWLACTGAPFDAGAWTSVAAEAEERERSIVERLDAAAPPRDGCLSGAGAWNWNSPAEVKAAFNALGFPIADSSDASLAGVDHPLAAALREHRSASQMVKTFGRKWPKHVQDGRLFAGWVQLGTDAGRSSCKAPNIQQVPKDPRYRRCFRAPEGRIVIKADYSQLQLRIACRVAQERRMLSAYQSGEDLHTLTASAITGKKKPTKADRQRAKAVNFGLLFGMGAESLVGYAQAEYGLTLALSEAMEYRRRFFKTYPKLAVWHEKEGRSTASECRTLLGRRRLLDDKTPYTHRLNSPVQGSEADGAKQAMALLWERREQCPNAFPILFVHDEVVVECDADKAEAAAEWLKTAMIDGMKDVLGSVPCEVEVSILPTWGGE